ncbi:response regulator transcription factor [Acidobacterium sp. S8]|uniref:LuxR C-terminal-related transcriptional regulator n=1 Tax=Acidobacterium sp. S8 TaxID=1641854 RepID=UPI00131B1573|nr:response regulator transcription factor [Acidobacterium sp. S8]
MNADRPGRIADDKTDGKPRIRVLVADEHPVIRIGVENLLQLEPSFEYAGEAGTGEEAMARTLELDPHILLLGLSLPDLPALETMRAVISGSHSTKTILLTEAISQQIILEGLQLGARGIVMKAALMDHLAAAIRAVSGGRYWIEDHPATSLVQALHDISRNPTPVPKSAPPLTPRELEVVGCVVRGGSNRDIAQQFNLSEETIKRHLSNIFEKTGVSTRLELALYAIEHQLVALPA